MDNEKKLDGQMPEEPVKIPAADEEEAEESGNDGETDELYERYIEIMNQQEEEEDIAAVAERITGERHSRVTTAAPLRIRTKDESLPTPVVPQPETEPEWESETESGPEFLELPKRKLEAEEDEREPEKTPVRKSTLRNLFLRKKTIPAIVAAFAVILVVAAAVVTVNLVNSRKEGTQEPKDLPLKDEIIASEETDAPPAEETDAPEPETAEPETEAETEPETEPEPIAEPEFTVTLDFYDRDDITTTVTQMTLAEVYDTVGYTPRETDRPSVALDSVIAADTHITIDTVEYKTESVTETVPYKSEVLEIDTIPRGEKNPITSGENGEVIRTYKIECVNGKETSRTVESEETIKAVVNEKYELGVGGSFVGTDGVTYTYSYRRTVPATAYSIQGLTYLGTMADESVIAVDTEKIPLGTKVYVKNDTYDFGVRIASDGGPKEKEWEVDIWLSPSNPQYYSFTQTQFHDMEIYYID